MILHTKTSTLACMLTAAALLSGFPSSRVLAQESVQAPGGEREPALVLESSEDQLGPEEEILAPPVDGDELVNLNLNKQDVSEIIEFIVRWTGKVVMVQEQAILSRKITVMSEKKVPKSTALEILYQAFKLNDIAVVETEDMIMIDSINDVSALQPGVVLGPEVDVEELDDDGNIVIKVFQIMEAKAQDIFERLDPSKPEYARLTVDVNSNQIIVESDIGYAKRVARLIRILDVEPYVAVKVETFRLRYADATTVAELVETLFASSGTASPQVNRTTGRTQGRNAPQRNTQQQAPVEVGTSEQLTVTVLEPTNSITVRAEPDIITEIRTLLDTAWDVAPAQEGEIFRIYDLKYTDPLKVKELLVSLLESGGTASAGNARGNNRGNAPTAGADAAVANIFRIEAYPDSNRLIVISKSPSNFEWLNEMIERIDMPLSVGMPINIELKHASAISVAEILNALLASSGAQTSITAPDDGLSGIDFNAAGGTSNTSSTLNTTGGTGDATSTISFPWQTQRGAEGESAEVSALVGKARVVPNASQNSLLVLATPEIQQAVIDIITELDRPGRQVMISAVLAEVELGDQFEFGLRFGQLGITPDNPDNAVVINTDFLGDKVDVFPNSLTQSIFAFNTDATVILQALDQVTNTRILQSPRLFTSDNQEAVFFDGQDVSVQTGTTVATQTTDTFDYRAVGIGVNVRPRITKEKNVAMQIEILLSNIDKNSIQGAGNNPTFKRRQTNTTITVKNGQTIVISGIRKESEGKRKNKVPLLGDIPILDWVFSNESDETIISELVVFITPIVVDNPDENDINFNEIDRRRLEYFKDPIGERMRNLQNQLGLGGPGTEDANSNRDPRRD